MSIQRAKHRTTQILGAGITAAIALAASFAFFELQAYIDLSYSAQAVIAVVVLLATLEVWDRLSEEPNIAEVQVSGLIQRDGGFSGDTVTESNHVVEKIEDANEDDGKEALLVRFNSQGGSPGPSEDIHEAISEFDGPTVALTEDLCASGGYLAAVACDRIIARPYSQIGSIGVIASSLNLHDLAERLGIEYLDLKAGEYKDAGHPIKEAESHQLVYLQQLIDGYYNRFIEIIARERDIPGVDVRGTEARVFRGREALEYGLVDQIGSEQDARGYLASELELDIDDLEADVIESSPSPLSALTTVLERAGYGLGRGVATVALEQGHDLSNRIKFR